MECQRCGACCKVFGIIEVQRNDDVPDDLIEWTEIGFYRMKTVGFTCIAYDENRHEHCGIYASRPLFCRRIDPGGKICRMAREQMALLRCRLGF